MPAYPDPHFRCGGCSCPPTDSIKGAIGGVGGKGLGGGHNLKLDKGFARRAAFVKGVGPSQLHAQPMLPDIPAHDVGIPVSHGEVGGISLPGAGQGQLFTIRGKPGNPTHSVGMPGSCILSGMRFFPTHNVGKTQSTV